MATLITNISQLLGTGNENKILRGADLGYLPAVANAYLIIEDDEIVEFGEMKNLQRPALEFRNLIDARGQFVLPAWCDSHTHLVFAATREEEFVDKIKGMSYAEIAARGGGILNSARKLNETSESELFNLAWNRLQEISRLGTGAVEIKSGYGLTTEGELKMLRVIRKLKEKSKLSIKATFLAAHAYPAEFKDDHMGYIDTITNDMLPVIERDKLADYIDVFCETGFFSAEEMERICLAGSERGLKPKLHVNQLNSIGGIEAAINLKAVSVDHLETMSDAEIVAVSNSQTIATLLPTAAFFLKMSYPPARKLIDSGAAVALASDYNPGSSPSGNMNLVIAMACIQMKMLPEEAINAATINGAHAMDLQRELGTIEPGKKANLIITKPMNSITLLPYSFGTNLIDKVIIAGEVI